MLKQRSPLQGAHLPIADIPKLSATADALFRLTVPTQEPVLVNDMETTVRFARSVPHEKTQDHIWFLCQIDDNAQIAFGITAIVLCDVLSVPNQGVLNALPKDVISTCLSTEIHRTLDAFGQGGLVSIAMIGEPPERHQHRLQCLLDGPRTQHRIAVALADDDLVWLGDQWDLLTDAANLHDIPFVASLDVACLMVPHHVLADLRYGEVVVLGPANPTESPYLNLRGAQRLSVHVDEVGDFTVQDILTNHKPIYIENTLTDTDDDDAFVDAHDMTDTPFLDDQTIAGLPVMVDLSLGNVDIPISELPDLAPGFILDVVVDRMFAVNLTVNGRVIGYGEIVQLDDDNFGVRITARV